MAANLDEEEYKFSHAAAILDGALIDVSTVGQRCVYPLKMAISFDLKEAVGTENFESKLVDLLHTLRLEINKTPADSSVMMLYAYPLKDSNVDILLEVGLDDEAAPCLTLMRADKIQHSF